MVALSPERAIEMQNLLGADIVMQLDECLKLPATRAEIERAMRLSLRWAERCKRAFEGAAPGRALFGIVQGGDDAALRDRERARARRHRLSRLRDRRARGRRAAGGDAAR